MAGTYLSEIFGKSPVRPMEKHINKVFSCVSLLPAFTQAVIEANRPERDKIQQNIIQLENEADALKKKLRLQLPHSLFIPISRRDLLELLTMQDKLASTARDICAIFVNRDMRLPETLQDDYFKLIETSIKACKQAQITVNELDELLETGFGVKELALMHELLDELDQLESEVDAQEAKLMQKLHSIERELDPVDVIFLYELIDLGGELADRAQQVGSRLQLMMAK